MTKGLGLVPASIVWLMVLNSISVAEQASIDCRANWQDMLTWHRAAGHRVEPVQEIELHGLGRLADLVLPRPHPPIHTVSDGATIQIAPDRLIVALLVNGCVLTMPEKAGDLYGLKTWTIYPPSP